MRPICSYGQNFECISVVVCIDGRYKFKYIYLRNYNLFFCYLVVVPALRPPFLNKNNMSINHYYIIDYGYSSSSIVLILDPINILTCKQINPISKTFTQWFVVNAGDWNKVDEAKEVCQDRINWRLRVGRDKFTAQGNRRDIMC